jgi:hypothetical protein
MLFRPMGKNEQRAPQQLTGAETEDLFDDFEFSMCSLGRGPRPSPRRRPCDESYRHVLFSFFILPFRRAPVLAGVAA